jgi:hypothetical protein
MCGSKTWVIQPQKTYVLNDVLKNIYMGISE